MGCILVSGTKYCLFSGSWSLLVLMLAQSLLTTSGLDNFSPFLAPTRSASSVESCRGLVSPDPFGILFCLSLQSLYYVCSIVEYKRVSPC